MSHSSTDFLQVCFFFPLISPLGCLSGSCYALTYNTNIDEDNTVALLPNGKHTHFSFVLKEMHTVKKKKSNHIGVSKVTVHSFIQLPPNSFPFLAGTLISR